MFGDLADRRQRPQEALAFIAQDQSASAALLGFEVAVANCLIEEGPTEAADFSVFVDRVTNGVVEITRLARLASFAVVPARAGRA